MATRRELLASICRSHHIMAMYTFGSRADQVLAWADDEIQTLGQSLSDVDVGVRPMPAFPLSVRAKARLAVVLEDLLGVARVDLVSLPDIDPFLAVNIVRGERLYVQDEYEADEYDLYVLRRAGDLIPLERERMALVLGEMS